MRVCHVITRLIVGGAQENTIASVLGLRDRAGFEVSLVSGPTTGPEGSLESRFEGTSDLLRIVPELVRPVRPLKDWIALRKLTSLFRRLSPDIVHTHSGKAGVLGRLAAHRAGVPLILHTIHGPSFGDFQGVVPNLIFRTAERYAARVTRHFITVADAMSAQYLAAGIGRPGDYTRIFSGFPLEPFLAAGNDPSLRARHGLNPGDFVIGKIARLFKLKGHDDLFEVAPAIVKACPSVRFLLVGGGEWRERLECRARDMGLARHFIFTGLVPPEEIPKLTGIMDTLVHLSTREGLARALPQALACGKPVVAYDSDGAREVCISGETGFLVRTGDLGGLADRLLTLAKNPALRSRLGERGRAFVQERFSEKTMVDALAALYARLGAGQPREQKRRGQPGGSETARREGHPSR
jgi:glycosyltransferase involved in cell wall biosynthesis